MYNTYEYNLFFCCFGDIKIWLEVDDDRRLESVGRTSSRTINAVTGDFCRYGWANSIDLLVFWPFGAGHFASIIVVRHWF